MRSHLACWTLLAFACVCMNATAFAKSDHWAKCRGADVDARITACSEIIVKGRETKSRRIAAYLNRSAAYRAKGDFDAALADLNKALQLDPNSAPALIERASIYQARDDFDRAIADYDRTLRFNQNLGEAYGGRASAYQGKGDLDRALADFGEAVRLDPASASLRVHRGAVYEAKGDYDRAIADYDAALERDPNMASVHNSRGLAYLAKSDFDRALADFSAAIELDPKLTDAFLNRANVYRDKQDFARAREDLETALRLDPESASAKAALDELNKRVAEKAKRAPIATSERPSPLVSAVLFRVGPIPITRPVVTTWAIMLVLSLGSWLMTHRFRSVPDRREAVLELLLTGIMSQIEDVIRKDSRPFLPLIGTLFIFLVAANLSPILPGVEAPTSKLETPAALALIVFVSVHYFGMRTRGFFGYLASFAEPKLIMLPLNIVSEVTRTFSLMVRLFGNVMSGEFVIGLVVALAGLFVPSPLMLLEILLGIIQAYIFTVLATVFIGAAIGSVEKG